MQNIVAVLFKNESEGFQAITELRQMPETEKYVILQMALIKRQGQTISVADSYDSGIQTGNNAAIGGLTGALVGILGGPIGVLLMGSYGLMAGSLVGSAEALDSAAMIETVSNKLLDGEIALVALAEEAEEAELDARLKKFDVEIVRFDAAVVAEEVEEAQEMQKEMDRLARKQLREVKKEERKTKIEEKRAKIAADFDAFKQKHKKASQE